MRPKKSTVVPVRMGEADLRLLDANAARHGTSRSEALRKANRFLSLHGEDEILARLDEQEALITDLRRRVGALEVRARSENTARKRLSRLASVRGAREEIEERERKLRILGATLAELQPEP